MSALDPNTLEEVASALERRHGNEIYRKAWRAAAKLIRSMKKLTGDAPKLTDEGEQIGSHGRGRS